MADRPEFVDMIKEATRQVRRRTAPRAGADQVAKEASRLSHWPPEHWKQWRTENLKPWKQKPWKSGDSE